MIYYSHPELGSEPLRSAEEEWFAGGNSFMQEGKRLAGSIGTFKTQDVEARSPPPGTSAQKAELMALTWALQLRTGKILHVYTDSPHEYTILNAHRSIWRQRVMLIAENKQVKHGLSILQLLEVVQCPKKVAVIHCRGHLKGDAEVTKGSNKADTAAKG